MFVVPEVLGGVGVDDIVGDVNAAGLFGSGDGCETEDGRRGRAGGDEFVVNTSDKHNAFSLLILDPAETSL